MSEINIEDSSSPAAPISTDPTVAGDNAATNSSTGYTAATKVSTTEDLKKIAPKLWDAMLQGIASNIVSEMQGHARRLASIIRKMRNGGY